MSRPDNWVMIDKSLVQEFANINRPFSRIEAMFSYTVDQDQGKAGSVKGYAKLWQWSRNKTRKFVEEIRTREGHSGDTVRTRYGHPIHFIDRGLRADKDTIGTGYGHDKDTIEYPTDKTKTNTKKKEKTSCAATATPAPVVSEIVSYLNQAVGTSFKPTTKNTQTLIRARLKEGFTLDDFKTVIDHKTGEWLNNSEMSGYLRPQTLFSPKFESYLQAAKKGCFAPNPRIFDEPSEPDSYKDQVAKELVNGGFFRCVTTNH